MIRFLSAFGIMLMLATTAFAQSGELSGKVVDEKGAGVPFATVQVFKGGASITGAKTDFDGFYTIKPLQPGNYDIKISSVGFAALLTNGVRISSDKITTIDAKLKVESTLVNEVTIVEYKVPLIDKDDNSSKQTITQEDIKNLPTRNIQSIASTAAGVFQQDEGSAINIRGARDGGTQYIIDGIRVSGSTNLPSQAIEQLTVITGGVPAKYGDATGGVINITTRGPSSKLAGGISGITSQGMDAVGYNDVNFNLTGPIWVKNKGTDSADAKVGFFIAGEYLHQKDASPSAIGVYKVNDAKLADLQQNPLVPNPTAKAFLLASETLTASDLVKIKSKQNVGNTNISGSGKIDFKVTDNIDVAVGANLAYNPYNAYVDRYELLNSVNNPNNKDLTWRGFARFTQHFGKQGGTEEKDQAKSAFQNAFYTLQFDYTKVYNTYAGAHGSSAFDYGYLGKYDIKTHPTFSVGKDSISNKFGFIQGSDTTTSVSFTPSSINPNTANFMNRYYQLAGTDTADYYSNLDAIRTNNGLLNGQRSSEVYSLWFNTGRIYNGYGVSANNDNFRLSLQGSVDVQKPGGSTRNKHSLEFGLEFEQRIQTGYAISPLSLWDIMRQEANKHLDQLDKAHPILLIDGVKYNYTDAHPAFGQNDTVLYNNLYQGDNQSFFDKSLRQKLGYAVNSTNKINIDALDPSTYSLNMFSADELLNNGSPVVSYYGYDTKGNKLSKNPSFNDFFFQKDANGNFTRAIGAFKPIYTAGYLQDKFNFKDLLFNVGVRVDRYDANQKTLIDPYSFYKVLDVDEAKARYANSATVKNIPTAVSGNYAVYVDDYTAQTPTILGYRKGDTWYNQQGVEVANAAVIARSSGNGQITPLLDKTLTNDIKSLSFDPSKSFTDYVPQITVMPRISFSFNVTDEALFFAHYDILTQRPTDTRNRLDITSYYFINQNTGTAINNPNLKPEKTIDYEVGFRQRVGSAAAVTFSAFYRELRDNIQLRPFLYAFPKNYTTYDNIDFGTVKGFSFGFDLRKSKTSNLGLKLNYTIQFAEGTGSNDASQAGILSAGQPNLRTIAPLDYDARHTFNVSLDYRFSEGKDYNGPKIKGKNFLENFGINLLLRGRSGTPYTVQSNATPDGEDGVSSRPILAGSKNGSRLPWTFRADLRIDKSFNLNGKKKGDGKDGRAYYFNVYLLIENILDQANVINVYHYTGNASDDGYLTSPVGLTETKGKVYPQSFVDLYRAWINNPANYSLPRQIRLGFEFNF